MKYFALFLISVLSILSCQKDTLQKSENCDYLVTMSAQKYNNTQSDNYSISNAEINGDCLSITVVASGCSGDTWTVELFDSKAIAESLPVQKYFRLKLINTELCHALISKTYSFDLAPSKLGENFLINLGEYDSKLLYEE